jgi:type II secretory pathway pseudopilin PulG
MLNQRHSGGFGIDGGVTSIPCRLSLDLPPITGEVVFYNVIKDFQSGLVGILGFIGVIVTLWWNAHSAEQTRAQELNQARQTLQSALHQELQSIREELANIRQYANDRSLQSFQFTLEQPYVYRTLVKDIGILQPETARTVIRVYRDLYLTMNTIRGMASNQDKAVATMEAKQFQNAASAVADVRDEIDEAIKALE